MIPYQEFEVDDVKYQTLHMPTLKSLKILTRLQKILSEPVGKAISAFKIDNNQGQEKKENEENEEKKEKGFFDQNIKMDFLGEAVTALGERLDEDVVVSTIKEILVSVEYKNESGKYAKVDFDFHFLGKIGRLYKVVWNVLKINYEDFLGPALTAFEKLKPMMTTRSEGTSTGTSGVQSLKE